MSDISTFADNLSPSKRALFELLMKQRGKSALQARITPRRNGSHVFSLSYAQQRLWFIDQLEPNSSAYNIPTAIRLNGALDVEALHQTFSEIVRRHEVLRTSFSMVDGRPVQVVAAPRAVAISELDLGRLAEAEREREVRRLARQEAARPFDLSQGPLLRVSLFRLAAEEHVLLVTMHHIVSDGWSMGVLVKEVAALYSAFVSGKSASLPELPIQYADYAVWQREWLQGEVLERQLSYWREQLRGASVLKLPTDRPRPAMQSYRGATYLFSLPARLSAQLKELSQAEGVTLFMSLLAAFQLLFARYSGQQDVVVGTPVAGRTRAEVEALIGVFVNTVVLRTDLSGEPTFRELLGRVRMVCLDAYAHQDVPFEQLVEELQPERDLSRTPIHQVSFVLQNAPMTAMELPGLHLTSMALDSKAARTDLTISMLEELDGQLGGSVEYNVDLFDANTIARVMGHFEILIEGILANPGQKISELPLLMKAEREQLLVEWNETASEYPRERCLHELFEEQAGTTPDQTALIFGEKRLSYRELNERANHLAHYLRVLGVGPEVRVGVLLERSIELVVSLLGVLKAGGAYVPLDPHHPTPHLSFIMEDATVAVLLTLERLAGQAPAHWAHLVCLDSEWAEIASHSTAQQSPSNGELTSRAALSPQPSADNALYVLYTSGSTGTPKGVVVSHRSVVNYLCWAMQAYDAASAQGSPVHSPLSFDLTVTSLFTPLLAGRAVTLVAQDEVGVTALARALRQEGCFSLVKLTPAHLDLLAQELKPEEAAGATRAFVIGGEALAGGQLEYWRRQAPHVRLINEYGPTETVVGCCTYEVGGVEEATGAAHNSSVPIGRPIANTQVYVLDERMKLVPLGVSGELYIGGEGLARGYLNQAQLTAEKFLPNPFAAEGGARLYRSGDWVRWLPEGELEFIGRVDQQVKLRGYRIELGEVEAGLRAHPAVAEAVVIARAESGSGQRLVAYLVACEGARASVSEMREYLREKLPEYMVPTAYVVLDEMPLTANGKVDRKALPAPEWAATSTVEYVGPRTPLEEVVCGVWGEVLGVEEVGAQDNFFELGGHSLLATQVISRLHDAFLVELAVRDLFEHQTVAELARYVAGMQSSMAQTQVPPLAPAVRDGELPLSYAQQRLWFINQLEPGSPLYNIPVAVRLHGQLDRHALASTLTRIVARHEVLRTTFPTVEGRAVQLITEPWSVTIPLFDLSDLPASEREAETQALFEREAGRGFDLGHGPLLRASLVKLGAEEHVLMVVMHHIVSDGWSLGVLVREVSALYSAFVAGETDGLEELPIQYADYAVWQREWLAGEVLERQLSYWKQILNDAPVLQLPTDRPRPIQPSHQGASQHFAISAELARQLKALSRREGATLFMTLLAGFELLLSRYSGQEDIVVGTPVAGRTRAEVESLIGFFVNTLVLRADLSGEPTFRELLARVREACLGAYAHQDVPFEQLVEQLRPERELNRNPLFQVMFALQNMPLSELELPGLKLSLAEADAAVTGFDLGLSVVETSQGLTGTLSYSTELFEESTIQRMVRHYEELLREAVESPEQSVWELPLLTTQERRQLEQWNETDEQYTPARCVHELFEEQAARTPEHLALICGEERVTFHELNERADQLAHYLKELGVGPEVRVGVLMERSIEMVVALLGTLKAGGAYVPLEPQHPTERLSFMMEDADVAVLLTVEQLYQQLQLTHAARTVFLDTDPHMFERYGPEDPRGEATWESLSYIIYTSGTTGRPKGALVTHGNLANVLLASKSRFDFSASDVMPLIASTAFDISLFEIFNPLLAGGTAVLLTREQVLDLDNLAGVLEGVTLLHTVPSLMRRIVEFIQEQGLGSGRYDRIRKVFVGGEEVPPQLLEGMRETFPRAEINVLYGPTEASIICASHRVPDEGVMPRRMIGRPLANVKLRVLDRNQNDVPIGCKGEIYIGGAGVCRGYEKQEEAHREKFILLDGERYYRTGDMARWLSTGELEFIGRVDQQVKLRGYRIELGEIESSLRSHPGLAEAAVVVTDEGADKKLVAYVVAHTQGNQQRDSLSSSQLREHVKRMLPEYMVPAVFVMLEELPLTANGKVDRQALPVPEWTALSSQEYVSPRTPAEQLLASIWGELLGIEKVGAHDNFFELGGDSILGVQIIARVRRAGLNLTLKQLFHHQTIAALAAAEPQGEAAPVAIKQTVITGEVPLTPVQQRFLYADQPDLHHFNQSLLLAAREAVNADAIERAVALLVAHHDALRSRFRRNETGRWHQRIEATESAQVFTRHDLSALSDGELSRAITAECERLQASLDLSTGPLLRVALFEAGAGRPSRLLIAIHHLVVDAFSWRVLLEDLAALYEQLCSGSEPELPLKTASYKQWAEALLEEAKSAAIEGELAYWIEIIGQGIEPLRMDFAGGENSQTLERGVESWLGAEQTRQLLSDVPAAYRTEINDVLLAALAQAFRRWSGMSRVLVEVEGHGHDGEVGGLDVSRTVGWFTTLYPVAVACVEGKSPGQHLKTVKEVLRRVPRRGVGYGQLRYLSALGATVLGASQRPEVSFNYLGQLDGVLKRVGWLEAAEDSAGAVRSALGKREYVLEVAAAVVGGRLRVEWRYSTGLHREETVRRLAEAYIAALEEIVAHCREAGTVAFTTSDFPNASLDQEDLDKLLSMISASD